MSIETEITRCKNSYFAASNSFDGFISYFDMCFSSREHDKVFVIKGGPGTGKSTLMKSLSKMADSEGFYKEEIYCSSDINSLDGVIIKNGKRSVAMLDGTAPHERDACIPGAVDSIVSLYDFFNEKGLEKSKEEIISLIDKKNSNYQKAYDQMHFSSVFHRKSKAEKLKSIDIEKAEEFASIIVRAVYSDGKRKRSVRLISAFGKSGYHTFDTLYDICDRIYSIKSDPVFAEAFLKIVENKLISTDSDFYILPSPFDKGVTEALYIPKNKTAIIVNGKKGSIIDANDFIKKDYCYTDELKEYDLASAKLLENAKKYFSESAKYHFDLEKIYSSNVNFDALSSYSEKLISDIKNILILNTIS